MLGDAAAKPSASWPPIDQQLNGTINPWVSYWCNL